MKHSHKVAAIAIGLAAVLLALASLRSTPGSPDVSRPSPAPLDSAAGGAEPLAAVGQMTTNRVTPDPGFAPSREGSGQTVPATGATELRGRITTADAGVDLSEVVVLAWRSGSSIGRRDIRNALEGRPPEHVIKTHCLPDGSYVLTLDSGTRFAYGGIGGGLCTQTCSVQTEEDEVDVPDLPAQFLYGAVADFVDAATGALPRGHASGRVGANGAGPRGRALTLMNARSSNPLSTYLAAEMVDYRGTSWTEKYLLASPHKQSPKVVLTIERPGYERAEVLIPAYPLDRGIEALTQRVKLVPAPSGWGLLELVWNDGVSTDASRAVESVARENIFLSLTNVATGQSTMILTTASSAPLEFEFPEGTYDVQLRSLDSPNRPELAIEKDQVVLPASGNSTLRFSYQGMGHISLGSISESYSDPDTELRITIYQESQPDTRHSRSILAGAPLMTGFHPGRYRVQITERQGITRWAEFNDCAAVEVRAGQVVVADVEVL